MARTNSLTNFLDDVATAIKQKTGDNTPIPASEFDTEILSIEVAGIYQQKTLTITQNGQTTLTPDTGFDAMDQVAITVNVPIKQLQSKTVSITSNGNVTLLPDTNYDGFNEVNLQVNVSSGSGDVKLFETEQAMQADADPQEGDLAVVYREELTGITEDSEFDSCIFLNEVVLDEAFTGNIYGSFGAVDQSAMFSSTVNMSSSRFRFTGYGDTMIRVTYTSSDGITYTRTDGGDELQEFGTIIKWESYGDPFDDVIGNFMKIGGMVFEGLYEYKSHSSDELIEGLTNVVSPSSYQTSTVEIRNVQRVVELVENKLDIDVGLGSHPSRRYSIIKINNIYRVYFGIYIDSTYGNIESPVGLLFTNNKSYVTFGTAHTTTDILITDNLADTNGTTYKPYCYDVDIINETVVDTQLSTSSFTQITVGSNIKMKGPELTNLGVIVQYNVSNDGSIAYNVSYITSNGSNGTIQNLPTEVTDYLLADSQLDAISESVYEKTFYGKNGVEIGTLGTPDNSFADTSAAVYTKVKKFYDVMTPRVLTDSDKDINKNIYIVPSNANGVSLLDTSSVTNMDSLFQDCKNLIEVSSLNTSNVTSMHSMFFGCTSLITMPQLNTSNVTNMTQMFYECSSLVAIPLLDTSNVTTMYYMFSGCTSLTTIPQLDTSSVTNIFGMFSGCTSLTTIPQLDTSNATNMNYMFSNCTSLSNESLNNILAMCTNATSYTGTKTLKYIGINATQATTCQSLSNYSAFTAAGWTTGY